MRRLLAPPPGGYTLVPPALVGLIGLIGLMVKLYWLRWEERGRGVIWKGIVWDEQELIPTVGF